MQGMIPPSAGPSLAAFLLEVMIISTIIGAVVYLLHKHDSPTTEVAQDKKGARVRPWMITTVMLILTFLGPVSLNIYPAGPSANTITIFSWTWQMSGLYILLFDMPMMFVVSLLVFLRPIFVYQLARYYKGLTTRTRTIIVGVISELQMTITTILVILYLLANPIIPFVFMIAVPFPLLLLLGVIFMWFVPVPEVVAPWKELDKPKDWWGEKSEARADAVFQDT